MIIEALLDLLYGLAQGLASFLRNALPAGPGYGDQFATAFNSVFALIPAPVIHFVPVVPVFALMTTLFGLIVTLGAIRFARRVLSLFTGGGGNA